MIYVKEKPYLASQLFNPNNTAVDWKLIVGAVCFGLGWGIGGLCPGPALVLLPVWNIPVHLVWFGMMLIGMLIAHFVGKIGSETK